jgi:hypothetical protein
MPFDEDVKKIQPHAGKYQTDGVRHSQTLHQHRYQRRYEKKKSEVR